MKKCQSEPFKRTFLKRSLLRGLFRGSGVYTLVYMYKNVSNVTGRGFSKYLPPRPVEGGWDKRRWRGRAFRIGGQGERGVKSF